MTIVLACSKCGGVRIVMPAWYTDDFVWCVCKDCGHKWNESDTAREGRRGR